MKITKYYTQTTSDYIKILIGVTGDLYSTTLLCMLFISVVYKRLWFHTSLIIPSQ